MKLKKVGRSMKLDLKGTKNNKNTLVVVDVSAVMRSNYVKLTPQYKKDGDKTYLLDDFGDYVLDGNGNRVEYYVPYNKFKRRELSWVVDGKRYNTSSMYGLLRLFVTFGFESDFVFCFDSAYNIRKEEDSDYKKGRTKAEKDYFIQFEDVKNLLENVGYTCLACPGYEGDDLAVECVNRNKSLYDDIIIVSNDYDLSQVIDEKVHFKHCLNGRDDITKDNFSEKVKCPYNSVLLYKALVGDASDNVKGVRGFGPVSFFKFLDEEGLYGELEDMRKNKREYSIIKNSRVLTDEQKQEALKCLWFVSPKVPDVFIDYTASRVIKKDLLEMYLEKYGMKSIIKELNK